MNTKEILTEARNLIAAGHWTQRSYADGPVDSLEDAIKHKAELPPGVCFCAVGAIGFVIGDYPEQRHPAVAKLALAIDPNDDYPSEGSVTAWNDYQERTREEVVAMFDKAIAS